MRHAFSLSERRRGAMKEDLMLSTYGPLQRSILPKWAMLTSLRLIAIDARVGRTVRPHSGQAQVDFEGEAVESDGICATEESLCNHLFRDRDSSSPNSCSCRGSVSFQRLQRNACSVCAMINNSTLPSATKVNRNMNSILPFSSIMAWSASFRRYSRTPAQSAR